MYVEVPDHPRRIVSLSPAITETLYMLGLSDRIAGVSLYCNKPPEAKSKPRVGSYWKVLYSKLEPLNPDLILVTTGAQLKILGELHDKGYTVYPISLPVTLYGVLDQIIKVGIVVGEADKARSLSYSLGEELRALKGALEGLRVHVEIDLGGPVAPGAITYLADAFKYTGASTTFDNVRVHERIIDGKSVADAWIIDPDPKSIKDFNPDVYIYEVPYGGRASFEWVFERLKSRGLEGLEAVRRGRLLVLEPDTLAHYGPSLIPTLAGLVAKIKALF
ncbi:MAG: ABC transporter substrate-binding protein [Thermoprotei archaeon]|nr:ABC transporter substrate-binding protein [Thermoprotei archaeon]